MKLIQEMHPSINGKGYCYLCTERIRKGEMAVTVVNNYNQTADIHAKCYDKIPKAHKEP